MLPLALLLAGVALGALLLPASRRALLRRRALTCPRAATRADLLLATLERR